MDVRSEKLAPLAAARSRVAALRGWRRVAVAFAAGGLSALAFAPMFAAPVLFLTLPVLVWLIDGSADWRQAFRVGWMFAFGYFFFNLFWIGEAFLVEADKFAWLLPFAITILPAGLALFWGAAAAIARLFWADGISRLFVLAIALSIFEWLRGHVLTGFPWNLPGYALTYPLPLMQSASLFGAYGLTAIAIFVFAAPVVLVADLRRPAPWTMATACAWGLFPIALLFAWGTWRLSEPQAFVDGVKMRIVQPSVPQREKWRPEYQRRIFDDHIALSLADPSGKSDSLAGITHLVWPEAAMPFFPLESPEALDILGRVIPGATTLITGAMRHDPPLAPGAPFNSVPVKNSIIVLGAQAKLVSAYDKIDLVPFGEFLPYEATLNSIGIQKLTHGRGSFGTGVQPRPVLAIPGLPPAIGLVCYEALFPGDVVQGSERPGVLINVTNDGWFGHSTGPYQHFHQSRVRAVEEGLPLIRAANNGISAVVDGFGRTLQSLGLDVRGVIDTPLPAAVPPTLYARLGDWMLALVLAAFSILAALFSKNRR